MKPRYLQDGPILAVVHLAHQHPQVIHQVTLDPAKLVLSGEVNLIRLGEFPGDEANGWQHLESVEILHILGTVSLSEDKKTLTVTPIKS